MDDHQDRLRDLEARRQMPDIGSWPWLQIIGLLVLVGLGATGRMSPEMVEMMSKLLPGR